MNTLMITWNTPKIHTFETESEGFKLGCDIRPNMDTVPYIDHPLTAERLRGSNDYRILDMNSDLVAIVYGATMTDGKVLSDMVCAAPAMLHALRQVRESYAFDQLGPGAKLAVASALEAFDGDDIGDSIDHQRTADGCVCGANACGE